MTDASSMSPKIAGAVSSIMKAVPMLNKGAENTHGKYNFASIDDFLEALRPLCAEQGLIIMQDEESYEASDGWLTMRFRFTLAHSSGDTYDAGCRTILVNGKMGSQAFGAAQSYALKQYMRSLFQVSTGEKGNDIDDHAANDLPKAKSQPGSGVRAAAAKPEWLGPLNKTALQQKSREIVNELGLCEDEGALAGLWQNKELQSILKQMRTDLPDHYQAVLDAKDLAKERCADSDERAAIQTEALNAG